MPPASSGAASTTLGSWGLYPAQTYTDATATANENVYQTAVRAPINADGTSTFAAKRGVVPVQFDLLAGTNTTTTTTRTYDPPVWQSIGSSTSTADDYSFATFTPSSAMTFSDIANLSATYAFTQGNCYVGSLRWTINVTHGTTSQNVHVYYGTPNGPDQGCSAGDPVGSGSGQNLISTGVADRFEIQGAGSPVYTTHANVAAVVGADPVNWVSLILDSGWKADQKADISNVTVNDNTFVPKTSEVINTETTPGTFTKTCDLPDAGINVVKSDASAGDTVNEAVSVQPSDTDALFRQVDCKYIYNLSVSSLTGTGTYRVYANIDGVNVPDPAKFDLK
jgi:hypothetical protein